MQLELNRTKLDKRLSQYALLDAQHQAAKKQRIQAENNLVSTEAARTIIQDVSKALQQEAHQRIATVVSKCLQAVFMEAAYELKIEFLLRRGKTEAVIKFVRDGLELDDPVNQAGGGVVDIAAFALRLACLVLQRPPLRRVMVLDEPLKCVRGKHYRSRVRALLQTLAKEMGVQFVICVDHDAYPEFLLGAVVEVGLG